MGQKMEITAGSAMVQMRNTWKTQEKNNVKEHKRTEMLFGPRKEGDPCKCKSPEASERRRPLG